MKSIKNLLRTDDKNLAQLGAQEMSNTKGGLGTIVVETMVEITCTLDGANTMLYCDRRRRRV